ncbi:hypothetical protein PTKIN_Ptkin03bG0109300 [Pterospermum kingtungense]
MRRIQAPLSCVNFGSGIYNGWHVFISCPFAYHCWKEVGLRDEVMATANNLEGCVDWFFEMLSPLADIKLGSFVMVFWDIWNCCNSVLCNGDSSSSSQVVLSSLILLCDWIRAKQIDNGVAGSGKNLLCVKSETYLFYLFLNAMLMQPSLRMTMFLVLV